MSLNPNIKLYEGSRFRNTKASEEYVHVTFKYSDVPAEWDGWVPVEYRRTGVSIPEDDRTKLEEHLNSIYNQMHPSKYQSWKQKQDVYWASTRSVETKDIFYILADGKWHCRNCDISNANFARRIQDLKESGYTIATHLNYHCPVCGNNRSTRLQLLPIDRVELAGNGYETWSPALRNRIISVLGNFDVYESTPSRNCLPDHKFSEIRWDDDTKAENPDTMTDAEIRSKFQLLSNQRNQQKREVCRNCFQTGQRGTIYGISFYYERGPTWDADIPTKGKDAEHGCVGCPWYDIARWKSELTRLIAYSDSIKNVKK
ncbi:MAG: restriction endonuclease [Oscillospiraceae bacterium]|nr:restriction endonuclease [Oscillospiraceae bacterium]